jgi:chromatin remodeling complex protein RSC6
MARSTSVSTATTPAPVKTSSKSSKSAAASVVDSSVASAVTPEVTKAPKKAKTSSKTESTTAAPVIVAPIAAQEALKEDVLQNEVVSLPAVTESSSSLAQMLIDLESGIKSTGDNLTKMRSSFRSLSKIVLRQDKIAQKAAEKKRLAREKRRPAGFTKVVGITDELAEFLGVPAGTQLPRTAVSKHFHNYFLENNLQNPENKKKINADAKVIALLGLQEGEEFGYFNLQHFLKPLFVKAAVVETNVAV